MGLTSALTTSLTGLALNETSIDVLGNNIANSGTNAFKASNVEFTTQLAQTISVGSPPVGQSGGTNPQQIGMGASTAAIRKDFTQGALQNTGNSSDLAIEGDGFFMVNGQGGLQYTRNGSFVLNSELKMTSPSGLLLQGYGHDESFQIDETALVDIAIPLGKLRVAQATTEVRFAGSLRTGADAVVGTMGTELLSDPLTDTAGGSAAANPITSATLLTSVFEDGDTTPLVTDGDIITMMPKKNDVDLTPSEFAVTATTTVAEYLQFIDDIFGIHDAPDMPPSNPSGDRAGVTVTAGGEIRIIGNIGESNAMEITPGDITVNGATLDLRFTKEEEANGASSVTDFTIYDSLGDPIRVKMTTVLEDRTPDSTIYRYFFESRDDSDQDIFSEDGTLTFDSDGSVVDGLTTIFAIDRDNTAAQAVQVEVDFSDVLGLVGPSSEALLEANQNGAPPGTLTSFNVDRNGIINGVFDNSLIRSLGQVVLARFSNPQGLVESGFGAYREAVNSGPAQRMAPGTDGVGAVRSGSLELSNTDIGKNLVDLIVASTNYRGNARVIGSVQQLVDELLLLGR